MKKWGLMCLSLAFASSASADVLGLRAGVSAWDTDLTGSVQSGSDPVDLSSDLGFGSETDVSAYVSFEHVIPLLPAVKLSYVAFDQDSDGTLSNTFRGIAFDGATVSNVNLKQTDLTVYWELLDNVVSLDLGVQGKLVTGEFSLQGATAEGPAWISKKPCRWSIWVWGLIYP